jgi:hypothetical protein
MLFRVLLAGAAAVALTATPAAAAELSPLKPCYVAAQPTQREPVIVAAKGFTPLATVDIYVDDILQPADAPGNPRASYTGDLSGAASAPFVEDGQRVFSLRLTERNKPANTVSATATVTRLAVEQTPARASTGDRVRFRGRGFTSLAPVYAHYVFAGRSRRTVKIGRPKDACGLFSVKRKQFPFKKSPRVGVWTIWFDQEPAYNPKAPLRVPLTIRVKPRIKRERARGH